MKATVYAHRFGDKVVPPTLLQDVVMAVQGIDLVPQRKGSKAIKKAIAEALIAKGWPGKVGMDAVSKITITSKKGKVGLCFQTGNMGRMYADLIKLQTLYLRGVIDAGVFIVPEAECAKTLGSNIARRDRLARELHIFERTISIPLAVIGIE